jgi:hypothetical protein
VKCGGQSPTAIVDIGSVSDRLGVKAIATDEHIPLLLDRGNAVASSISN